MATVLIVEDDEAIADALASLLEDAGHVAVSVREGRAALDALRSGGRICAILLDLTMPQMNGWRFREEQMRDPALARIPVIVCTADGDAEGRARELGAAGFVRKPIDPARLLALVAAHCEEPTARA